MRLDVFRACVVLLLASSFEVVAQGSLTPQEQRWVAGAEPVVEQARRAGLPVDIIVQPQPAPGTAPLALAFVGGRCKLVFSMRDNAQVQEQEERIAQDLGTGRETLATALEFMAAHELFGHCARHVAGQWHALPDGYVEAVPDGLAPALHVAFTDMRAARREEGYADLAALAWAHAHCDPLYARLHAWLTAERSRDLIEGSHHDTLAWLRRAGRDEAPVLDVWRSVLLEEAHAAAARDRPTSTTQRRADSVQDALRLTQR